MENLYEGRVIVVWEDASISTPEYNVDVHVIYLNILDQVCQSIGKYSAIWEIDGKLYPPDRVKAWAYFPKPTYEI